MKILIASIVFFLSACTGDEDANRNNSTKNRNGSTLTNNRSTTRSNTTNKGGTSATISSSTPSATTNDGGQSNGTHTPRCGDSIIEGDELCDGEDFNGKVCENGILLCAADCLSIDLSQCVPPSGEITSCRLLTQCLAPCTNTECFRSCANRTTEPARSNAVNLGTCISENMCRMAGVTDEACVNANCLAESMACDMN